MSNAELVNLERHNYDDPFLDVASLKLPKTFKKLLELCQIFALSHGQVSPIIWRLAEYPIAGLVYKADEKVKDKYKELFEKKLKIMEKIPEWGIDYYGYGNAFITISFGFIRFYRCKVCKKTCMANELDYTYREGTFTGKCNNCRAERDFTPEDEYIKDPAKINIFRLEPLQMDVKYNRVTGQYFYHYEIPEETRNAVNRGDRDIIDTTPIDYLKCIQMKRKMRLKRVFHFKRPTISGRDMAWGFPLVMPALKDIYLNQIYKKADEQIALEHSVPLRFVYPEPTSQDPLRSVSMGTFKKFVERNIKLWRKDKNAIITSPVPVGARILGGDANQYSTINARIKVVDEIMGAMMVTRGFVMGGEQWSSASISQRVMENAFISYLRRLDACLQWVCDEVRAFLELPECEVSMKPFKKIDDIQMLNVLIGMAQNKNIPWDEVLSRMDIDYDAGLEKIADEVGKYSTILIKEIMSQTEAQARAASVMAQGQEEAQSYTQMFEDAKTRAAGQIGELQGTGTIQQTQEQATQAQQAQGQQQQQVQQLQMQSTESLNAQRAARTQLESAKATSMQAGQQAQAQPREQVPPQQDGQEQQGNNQLDMNEQIERWAQEIIQMPAHEAQGIMQQMAREMPEMAQKVSQRADEIKAKTGGGVNTETQQNYAKIAENSSTPEELAQKIQMLQPKIRLGVIKMLQVKNPSLFTKVITIMSTGTDEQKAKRKSSVDMRPLPEQLPPTREDRPV